ncbi:TetR/AcrR family transcriptional regulator [Arthrobacter sp. ISL-69]|uniref:TetR/AcrR family transcriptional regulator n=1 Tax=Arthrobacter sp. ISL-69 TaxID=2819113 RepID=UPI001BE74209|nr:TetR/AcrR family transcriptional regulator [Arthrobacter sp. ISL-69]MBT2535432.1 TetR/AcrR family transcriptional regulator [Arthrobacter sp. ISL-69]
MAGRKQFDVDKALDQVMTLFWQRGYAETSLDHIVSATGLGKGSLYGTFGGKPELFRRSLDRYAGTYGLQYEAALSGRATPALAIQAFFDVVLARIADPILPGGCLIALSAMAAPTLDEASRDHVRSLLDRQRQRVQAALEGSTPDAAGLALFVVSTNQALAVMDRAGARADELAGIASVAVRAVKASTPSTD